MTLEEAIKEVKILTRDLYATILVQEESGHYEHVHVSVSDIPFGASGACSDATQLRLEHHGDYDYDERVVDIPRIIEPDKEKQDAARNELCRIENNSEWYGARYGAAKARIDQETYDRKIGGPRYTTYDDLHRELKSIGSKCIDPIIRTYDSGDKESKLKAAQESLALYDFGVHDKELIVMLKKISLDAQESKEIRARAKEKLLDYAKSPFPCTNIGEVIREWSEQEFRESGKIDLNEITKLWGYVSKISHQSSGPIIRLMGDVAEKYFLNPAGKEAFSRLADLYVRDYSREECENCLTQTLEKRFSGAVEDQIRAVRSAAGIVDRSTSFFSHEYDFSGRSADREYYLALPFMNFLQNAAKGDNAANKEARAELEKICLENSNGQLRELAGNVLKHSFFRRLADRFKARKIARTKNQSCKPRAEYYELEV